jgi:hypothetical protein
MSTPRARRPSGRTSWIRLAIVMVPTLIVSGAVLATVAAGLLPVSLAVSAQPGAISGQSFQVAADRLEGTGFTQYVVVDKTTKGDFAEAVSGIKSADLHNLCQSVVTKMPMIGSVTLVIKAGGGSKPVHADRLVVNTDDLAGDAEFHNIIFGQDASTLSGVSDGPAGALGQQADTVRIDHLRQTARSVSAATFRLTDLHLTVRKGSKPCF